jgi:putative transcription antitermination factor YqgF
VRYLALDIGRKHTGVAYADATIGVPIPLPTIKHKDTEEFLAAVETIISRREVDALFVGLPLLRSSKESTETAHVRHVTEQLRARCPSCPVYFLDERETSRPWKELRSDDPHTQAAVTLLTIALDREKTS